MNTGGNGSEDVCDREAERSQDRLAVLSRGIHGGNSLGLNHKRIVFQQCRVRLRCKANGLSLVRWARSSSGSEKQNSKGERQIERKCSGQEWEAMMV